MKPDLAKPLRSLPADMQVMFETRYMVALAHGVHMLSYCLPGSGPLRRISIMVAEITRCAPEASYSPGDFERLGKEAQPDPEAGVKLQATIDLIWRSAAFQGEPVRAALVDLVSGFTEQHPLVV